MKTFDGVSLSLDRPSEGLASSQNRMDPLARALLLAAVGLAGLWWLYGHKKNLPDPGLKGPAEPSSL